MNETDKKLLNFTNYTLLFSSVLYAVFKYFLKVEGDWGPEAHFLTKYFQAFHILFSPFLIFSVGMIFKTHILHKIQIDYKILRKSGLALVLFFTVMGISGYIIQVTTLKIRDYTVALHLVSALLWAIFYIYHAQYKSNQIKEKAKTL